MPNCFGHLLVPSCTFCTTVEFSSEVVIQNIPLDSGKYTFFVIPRDYITGHLYWIKTKLLAGNNNPAEAIAYVELLKNLENTLF